MIPLPLREQATAEFSILSYYYSIDAVFIIVISVHRASLAVVFAIVLLRLAAHAIRKTLTSQHLSIIKNN